MEDNMEIIITFIIASITGVFGYWLRGKMTPTPKAEPLTETQKSDMQKKEKALKELMSYGVEKAIGGNKQ